MEQTANHIILRGSLASMPQFSHENHGRRFFRFLLEVPRLSGAVDVLPVVAREDVLNSRSARFVTCPICQRRGAVSCWYPQGKELYYGTFCCGEHGRFPVRMAVVQRKDGQWQGRRTVPQVTEQEKAALRSARRNERSEERR